MIGVAVNALGTLIGSFAGLGKLSVSPANESFLKLIMGAATVAIGLHLTWSNLGGSFGQVAKQLAIVLLSMTLGKLLGKLLRLQKLSNRAGQFASVRLAQPKRNANDAFMVASVLACASPLAIFASVHEGLSGFSTAFIVKALMDGLAAMAFAVMFGSGVVLSVLPVLAYQGTIVLLVRAAEPFLRQHGLVESILATNGLLIFSVSLIILSVKKIELTDYVPSLAVAPLLTWLLR